MSIMPDSVGLFYTLHITISTLFSFVASAVLRKRFKDHRYSVIAFFLFFNIALPGVGYFFTLWLIYYFLHVKYAKIPRSIQCINMNEFETGFPEINRIFGESSMEALFNGDAVSSSLKMKALVSMADNLNRHNLMMIKNSLSDKDDEIRLYSFSIINKMEQELNQKIHEALTQYQNISQKDEKIKIAEELAFLYWDMVYYELSDENLKRYMLNEVHKYAAYVLEHYPNHIKINVLLGRVYLMLESFDQSESCFLVAMQHEKNPDYIYPYLAEISYNKRFFNTTHSLIENASSMEHYHTLHPVLQQWKSA